MSDDRDAIWIASYPIVEAPRLMIAEDLGLKGPYWIEDQPPEWFVFRDKHGNIECVRFER